MAASSDSSDTDKNMPALIHGPKAPSDAEAFGPVIDLEAVQNASAGDGPSDSETAADDAPPSRGWRVPHYAPLAAGIALAAMGGAIAGVAATMALTHDTAPAANLVTVEATKSLQSSVAQLGSEIATLKSGVTSAQKNASTQLGKIADRLDRAEKAQAEPVGKLAKIQESIDRLEHHQQVAAAPAAAAAAADITGSIKPKDDAKPQIAEGWKLRDFFDGHAIIEGKNGTLFRVGPGSQVPGLGKVETIKHDNGKVVVVTGSGIISAALEPPRRPSYYPRW
jgi:hypothetical protein